MGYGKVNSEVQRLLNSCKLERQRGKRGGETSRAIPDKTAKVTAKSLEPN